MSDAEIENSPSPSSSHSSRSSRSRCKSETSFHGEKGNYGTSVEPWDVPELLWPQQRKAKWMYLNSTVTLEDLDSPDEVVNKRANLYKKLCESICRRFKSDMSELVRIMHIVRKQSDSDKDCIAVKRSNDNRFQVDSKKLFPHLALYCLFRELVPHKNELSHTEQCQHPFEKTTDEWVCINPWHYKRRRHDIPPPTPSPSQHPAVPVPLYPLRMFSPTRPQAITPAIGINYPKQRKRRVVKSKYLPKPPFPQDDLETEIITALAVNPTTSSFHNFNLPTPDAIKAFHQQSIRMCLNADNIFAKNIPMPDGFTVMPATTYNRHQEVYKQGERLLDQPGPVQVFAEKEQDDICSVISTGMEPEDDFVCGHWATFCYYEKQCLVGDKHAYYNTMFIDGRFISSGEDHFNLGSAINTNRDAMTEKIRRGIGQGVRLSVKNNGDVWLRSFSQDYVFISSSYLDQKSGRDLKNVVHKMYPGSRLKVYDTMFAKQQLVQLRMKQLLLRQYLDNKATPCNELFKQMSTEVINKILEDEAQDLKDLCVVNLAFVKGFGPSYSKRPKISDCEAWVEVRMVDVINFGEKCLTMTGNEAVVQASEVEEEEEVDVVMVDAEEKPSCSH